MNRFWLTLFLLAPFPAPAASQQPWPAAVSNAGITWEGQSRRILLYGGMRDRGLHRDSVLWAWDGSRWQPAGDGAPGARSGAQLAWDSAGSHVLLYGGQNAVAQFDDTWEWNGERWSRIASSGPGLRHMTAAAFDPVRRVWVLFGGYSVRGESMLGDTWIWAGRAWRKIEGEGPPARAGHAMGFDQSTGRVVLMGGSDARGHQFGDSWSWDGRGWTSLGQGPSLTPNSQLAGLPGGGLAGFGGWDGNRASGSLHVWSHNRWTEAEPGNGPSARLETALAYDAVRGRLVLFGGSDANGQKLADLWEFDGSRWIRIPGP